MTFEIPVVTSNGDHTSISVGIARLEERLRTTSTQLKQLLQDHKGRESERDEKSRAHAVFEYSVDKRLLELEAQIKECLDIKHSFESFEARLKEMEARRSSSDRHKAEAAEAEGAHRKLQLMETTQRVEESKWRSRLWKALAATVATIGTGIATWLATRK